MPIRDDEKDEGGNQPTLFSFRRADGLYTYFLETDESLGAFFNFFLTKEQTPLM